MSLIGIANAILMNIAIIAGMNDPQLKVTPTGFLQMLLEQGANGQVVNAESLRSGGDKVMKIRYMQRGLESQVGDVDDCETTVTPAWQEATIERPMFSKIGIRIDDSLMRKLETEAVSQVQPGQPPTPMFYGLYQTMLVKLNGLIQHINSNLLLAQSTSWGVNAAYGTLDPQALKFGGKMTMDNGIVKLILDAQMNEIDGEVVVVGNGIVNAFQIMNGLKTGVDYQGYPSANFKVYNDFRSASLWGPNHFGVFAKGLSAFVDFNKNVGSFSGLRGGSYFFTIPIPVVLAKGTLSALLLDAQLKYVDCPETDSGITIADRGLNLLLSKSYGLWNAPIDMFATGDRLSGFNGSLHYVGENADAPAVEPPVEP